MSCRLFVYLARELPIGVVLRRGPSEWVRLSVWHTDDDTFEHGQWMQARVYERRSDVSADGSLFAAFVRQSSVRPGDAPKADSWIAVSRPPYFTALAVWFIGGTYHTGGFFPDRSSIWLGFNDIQPDIGTVPAWLAVRQPRDIAYTDGTPEWTDRTVHFNRLLRDGWEWLEKDVARTIWQRRHPNDARTLLMTQQFGSFQEHGGPYVVEYAVRDEKSGTVRLLGRASWADWDQQGRLVLAQDGWLRTWLPDGRFEDIEAFDNQKPDPAPAPEAMSQWPGEPRK